tara:strand:- start:137 stop:688 length:552 start_codon:yes stop_codon:yes gene_type:complete
LRKHLSDEKIEYRLFTGVNAAEMGLTTINTYEVDGPGSGYIMPQKHTGLCLSHWLLWKKLFEDYQHFEDPHLVVEDDVEFLPGWRDSLDAIKPPEDWDMILIGSCNCMDKARNEVSPGLFKVHQPQCTHAYLVRSKALPILIEEQKKIWAPIDLALIFGAYNKLNVYTVLPRICGQYGQEIMP